jgi:5-formyltetrahydrofolate cyclo-ligase
MTDFSKQQWRDQMKKHLAELTDAEYQKAAQQIEKRFFAWGPVRRATVVMLYYAINREAPTIGLITGLLARGRRVVLPVCTADGNLITKEIHSLEEVRPTGKLGLVEPGDAALEVAPSLIELAVVPGLAFDRYGNRLGHGRGYYDRFFNSTGLQTVKLGLAHDFQLIDRVPAAGWDVKMDVVLTPSGLFNIISGPVF